MKGLSELLSNLIAKYADILDLDSMPNPDTSSKDTDMPNQLNKNNQDSIAAKILRDILIREYNVQTKCRDFYAAGVWDSV